MSWIAPNKVERKTTKRQLGRIKIRLCYITKTSKNPFKWKKILGGFDPSRPPGVRHPFQILLWKLTLSACRNLHFSITFNQDVKQYLNSSIHLDTINILNFFLRPFMASWPFTLHFLYFATTSHELPMLPRTGQGLHFLSQLSND